MNRLINKLLIFVFIFAVFFGVYINKAEADTDASLLFNQANTSVNVGQTVTLIARINPGTNEVGGVELDVNFNPAVLRLDSVTKSDSFNITLSSATINNINGTASIDVGLLTDPATYITSTTDVAIFVFTALSSAINSPISFASTSNASSHGEYVIATRVPSQITIDEDDEDYDSIKPSIASFTIPSTSASLAIPIIDFGATDNVGVAGYKVTETSIGPSAEDSGWNVAPPTSYTFSSAGTKTLYAWAKDAAGNISDSASANIVINLLDTLAPIITSFSIPSSSSSLTVPISSFIAEDNIEISGYILTEESSSPSRENENWSGNIPPSYTFSLAGVKTLYAWVKDAAGNISNSLSDSVEIIIENTPDENDNFFISNGEPTGELSSNTTAVNLSLKTNKNAACKFSEDDSFFYDNMGIDFTETGGTNHSYKIEGVKEGRDYEYYAKCKDSEGYINKNNYSISFSIKDKDSKKEEEETKRKITNSQSSINMGQTLIQKGKRFSKNSEVLLYFSKTDGSYYPPMKIKTNSDGKFEVAYKVNKPKGKYNWYAVDIKTGRKSKIKDYTIR